MLGQENPTTPPASPAGAPVSASHRRLSRIARKHSNGSVQSSSSSGTAKSTENVGIRQPAKSKIRRHQHRLSAVFSRGARRLSGEMASSEEVKEDPSELSNHITAPGILKIFGTEICEGANYKSVLATTHSSAKELVKEALARYSLNKEDADHYVLCDVIGCIGDQPWRTECLRVVGDNEKPLLLQSLWKPREGYARRFEIQRKAMVDEKISRDKDTVTAGLNEQARKLQKTRSRGKSATLDMDVTEVTVDHRLFRSLSETDLKPGDDQSSYGYPSLESRKNVPILTEREEPDSGAYKVKHCAASERAESESSDDNSTQYSIHPPLEFPYFLLLQGFSFRQDFVIYPLTNNYTIFGRHVEDICNENEAEAEILRLWAPDILPQHCHIRRLDIGPGSAVGRRGCVTLLTPLNRAKVKRNGVSVHQEVDLQSGDIIGLGDHYLFMYKDPASPRVPANPALTLQWQDEMSLTYKLPPLCKTCVLSEKIRKPTGSLCFRDVEGHELVLVYDVEHETRVLKEIFATIEQYKEAHKLTPSFLLCLCIQQSATRFSMPALRRLLLQAANEVQMVVWEKAKELAALQPEFSQSDLDDPSSSTDMIIRVLEPLVLWMANSIQLLHFVHQEVPHLLHGISQEEEEEEEDCIAVLELRLSSVRSASEEAMTVLEEVLMFTFQQCVYYLTKILYPVLPGLLDNNPFSESGHLQVSESVKGVLDICTKTLHLVRGFQVHPQITLQLFAYLFFFINALLFNLLMERGSGGTFYHWSHGVQIRANLDQLMDWAHGAGLGDLAHSYLLKLSSAVNLLATPKENLSQMSWNSLRMEFASLNPAQLHHLLREYSPQRCRAAAWTPPSDEESAALRTADILESFDKHPPLILPVDGFLLALNNPFSESDLIDQLRHFQKRIRKLLYSESDSDTDISQLVSAVPVEAKLSKMEFDPSAQLATVSPHSGTSDLGACEALLTKKLQNLELQNKGVNHCSVERPMLDPSCLLTPPNTPQSQELTELDSSKSLGDLHEEDESKLGCETEEENVFVLELQRAESALGLVLMDGMATSTNGIIISSVIPDSPAALSQMIKPGDHILAVNGVSLVGMDFQTGKEVIQLSGDKPQLLITRTAIRKKQE